MSEHKVTLDWSGATETVARAVNVVRAGELGDEVIIFFGHAVPPIEATVLDPEQSARLFKEQPIKVKQVTCHTLTVEAAATLAIGLNSSPRVQEALRAANVESRQAAGKEGGDE